MKRILAVLLAVLLSFSLTACSQEEVISTIELVGGAAEILMDEASSEEQASIDEDGWYYSAEDVSLYLHTYSCLPENFITKAEARELGWEGGSVEVYAPGYAIGGDSFGNREGLLPEDEIYYECDIDTNGQDSRGAKRLVFSDDLIYYTDDHYESFTLLYGEE